MNNKLSKLTKGHLSRYPALYALIVGAGIIMFWRGVWHFTDHVFQFIYGTQTLHLELPFFSGFWWDGPVSILIGIFVLYLTGALVSSFIGNELILSGLRGEQKLTKETEADLKTEVLDIGEIKDELFLISRKLEIIQQKADKNHVKAGQEIKEME